MTKRIRRRSVARRDRPHTRKSLRFPAPKCCWRAQRACASARWTS